jgi:DNA invertase Pin-like site-specific DNA recombinase
MQDQTDTSEGNEQTNRAAKTRAAQYVRMSTDQQQYSIENQATAIAEYAAANGFQIVAEYADEGRSGLTLRGRGGLERLLQDVVSGVAEFDAILVYDVSRWGRFQDADEAAHYEFICRRAGKKVCYCAEPFENDGTPLATVFKGVKRAMAGEYSRELSAKVIIGQMRLAKDGYRLGAPAGYGLRRAIIDSDRNVLRVMERGEHKAVKTDRVILVPGPTREVEVVEKIFNLFNQHQLGTVEIADVLNADGAPHPSGAWNRIAVYNILAHEKYAGIAVFNKRNARLRRLQQHNDKKDWIVVPGAWKGIVSAEEHRKAKRLLRTARRQYTDSDLLMLLKRKFVQEGHVSESVLDRDAASPNAATFSHRFGGLYNAYEAIGFQPARDNGWMSDNRILDERLKELRGSLLTLCRSAKIHIDLSNEDVVVDKRNRVRLCMARSRMNLHGYRIWIARYGALANVDFVLIARTQRNPNAFRDFFLIPSFCLRDGYLMLGVTNPLPWDRLKSETLLAAIEKLKSVEPSEAKHGGSKHPQSAPYRDR